MRDSDASSLEQYDNIRIQVPQHEVSIAPGTIVTRESQTLDQAPIPEEITDLEQSGVSNPLVSEQPTYISDNSGRLRYLGHSSTWSFSRQVLNMVNQSPHSNPSTEASLHVEGEVYNVSTVDLTISQSDIAGIPSMDLALYYLQSVKFRTHPILHLFDEADFSFHLHRFYESPATYGQSNRIWFVHFLILMAFGKAFVKQTQPTRGPTGSDLFARALRLLPDTTYLCYEPVESTEILCCIALYLQSIDHRSAAHIYVSACSKEITHLMSCDRLARLYEWLNHMDFMRICRSMLLVPTWCIEVIVFGGRCTRLTGEYRVR